MFFGLLQLSILSRNLFGNIYPTIYIHEFPRRIFSNFATELFTYQVFCNLKRKLTLEDFSVLLSDSS